MHELSVALSMLELAEEAARREGASRIEVIHLEIGALAGVIPEALEFAFECAKQGTMAGCARLNIDYVPAIAYCERCELEFEVESRFGMALCPACETPTATLHQGFELNLRHLEVI